MEQVVTRRSILALTGGAVTSAFIATLAGRKSKEIIRESAYNYVIINETDSIVYFRRMENGAVMSAIDLRKPAYQVINYTKYLFAGSYLSPQPSDALSIGLGAGAFNRLFNIAYPHANLTTVEVDPMIREIAIEYTGFKESTFNKVVIDDGRRFLQRTQSHWDWIVIDAYIRNSQVPPHLCTREFFEIVASHLNLKGILIMNMGRKTKLFECVSTTLSSIFPSILLFLVPTSSNTILVASTQKQMFDLGGASDEPVISRVMSDGVFRGNGVDLFQVRAACHAASFIISCKAPLTDDFSPTEFMDSDWRNQVRER